MYVAEASEGGCLSCADQFWNNSHLVLLEEVRVWLETVNFTVAGDRSKPAAHTLDCVSANDRC